MSDPNDILDNLPGESLTEEDISPSQLDDNQNYFDQLVGEDKKFKDPEALAKGKFRSDQFITRLESENATLRQELQNRLTMEEFIDKMSSRDSGANYQDPSHQDGSSSSNQPSENPASSLSAEDIEQLLETRLSQREQQQTAEKNAADVKKALTAEFGPDYSAKVTAKLGQLGISKQEANRIARSSPSAFKAMLGIGKQEQTQNFDVLSSSVNEDARSASAPTPKGRTMSYYRELKQKDPKRYWTREIQAQEHKDAVELGPAFFN